jgi:pyruvate ferredoxin oxidoreductase gamma subunit
MGALEIRLHGRGGQGTVTMAALLCDAAARAGWHVLGFPAFGTERTGAPVAAFVRIAHEPVRDRSEVRRPTYVVVQDPTLASIVDVAEGATDDALVVLNADEPRAIGSTRVVAIPATRLAIDHLGKPITSTAMLGAFAAATGIVGIDDVDDAIRARFSGALAERNVACACAAYDEVVNREALI